MTNRYRTIAAVGMLAIAHSGLAHATAFQIIPAPSVAGCSSDGQLLVGPTGSAGYRWTPDGGLVSIGGLTASGVSSDGSVIVGNISNAGVETAARWTEGGGWSSLGSMAGGEACDAFLSSSWGTNGDGSVIVGLAWVPGCRAHGFRWESSTGLVDLGSTVANRSSRANGVSADGSVIVGWQDGVSGFRQGAYWVGGVQTLLWESMGPDVFEVGEAQAATPDGSIIVGGSTAFGDAYRWTGGPYVESIGGLSGFNWRSSATDVSDDGSVIVGWSGFGGDRAAFIWIEGTGILRLDDYLDSVGIDTQGLVPAAATGISGNGRIIVGWGFEGFTTKGFRVDLDGVVGVADHGPEIAGARPQLGAAPNPLHTDTMITYELTSEDDVTLAVYGASGTLVRTLYEGRSPSGTHRVRWDGRDDEQKVSAPGVYFVRLDGSAQSATSRVVLVSR
jgi:uncharacterized membrane protein